MTCAWGASVIGGQGQQRTGKIRGPTCGEGYPACHYSNALLGRRFRAIESFFFPAKIGPARTRRTQHIAQKPRRFIGTAAYQTRSFCKRPDRAPYVKTMENIMRNLMLGTAIAAVLGSAAVAQDMFRTEMDTVAIAASDFIGKRVYAAEAAIDAEEYAGVQDGWNDIGEINDVILTRDGKVDAVLVDIGGFLGIGERQVAVGMENIRFVSDSATAEDLNDFFLVVNADRATLEGAPEYMRTGAMPTEATTPDPMATEDTATAPITNDAATADTEVATTEPETDGATTADTMTVDGYAAVDPAAIASDQLMGVRVYGPNEEDIGEISDFIPDANGAPAKVIVDVGGFLGMGEKPVAIDVTSLQIMQATDGDTMRAYVQMTQEELESLPATNM
jgi:hypothetical protein